jgi:Pyruvate/2-oxoacid:ferredoxin oxidoreductase delta subunit
MAIKKVVKKRFASGTFAATSRSREQSPLRPEHMEKTAPCVVACPSGNCVRRFVTLIAQAERLGKPLDRALEEAWHAYTDTSPFPAVCGRVCTGLCEAQCNRKDLDSAVQINRIERAIGDFGIEKNLRLRRLTEEKKPQRIAVVGAGPSGLSCAYQLARRGYAVTIFEALERPGGMLRGGIPSDQLPESVLDAEIQRILDLGVELLCGDDRSADASLDALRQSYDAVHVDPGLQKFVAAAIGHGRRAAEAIDRQFLGVTAAKGPLKVIRSERMRLDHYEKKGPLESPVEEARRCMSCGYCFDCEKCWLFCQDQAIGKPLQKGTLYHFKLENCTGCKKCADECPCGFLEMA